MNKLLKNSLVASTIAVAGIVMTAPNAFAEPVTGDVLFSGTVAPTCTLTNSVAGVLGVNPDDPSMLTENGLGGQAGTIQLDCNSSAEVSVSLPINNGSDVILNPSWMGATVMTSGGQAFRDSGSFENVTIVGPSISENLSVGMYVVNGAAAIPMGNYAYRVTVTAAPQ